MDKSSLGDRMKKYESASQTKLLRRTPVIIRIDGKAFHTWTKRLKAVDPSLEKGPFSELMHKCMLHTTEHLYNNIQNAALGYTQSDEISILLNDWKRHETDQWFDSKVQKMVSVAASMATAYFNFIYTHLGKGDVVDYDPAMFDARVFNLPKEEVTNYFIWRQQDASRNSVQMLGRFYFSHKEMNGKNNSQVQDMLMEHHGVNWNDISEWKKRGSCVDYLGQDDTIPIFTQERYYIENLLKDEEEDKACGKIPL